jgi:hypothetical protein
MEIPLLFLLFVQYANSNRSCQYPFIGPIYTILESVVTIDFNLNVGTIFVEKNFSETSFIAIHHSSFHNGLSNFLLKLNQDSSFMIIG